MHNLSVLFQISEEYYSYSQLHLSKGNSSLLPFHISIGYHSLVLFHVHTRYYPSLLGLFHLYKIQSYHSMYLKDKIPLNYSISQFLSAIANRYNTFFLLNSMSLKDCILQYLSESPQDKILKCYCTSLQDTIFHYYYISPKDTILQHYSQQQKAFSV